MSCIKMIRWLVSWFVKMLVYAVLGLPTVLCYTILKCKLYVEVRRLNVKRGEVSNAGDEDKELGQAQDATEDVDFKLLRAQSYIENVTFGRLLETVKLVDLQQKVPLITNIALRHVLFDSFFGLRLRKEQNPYSEIMWRFSFEETGRYVSLKNYPRQVSEILITKSGKMNIMDASGKIHTPKCKTWPLAKAHVQAQLTLMAPGVLQNLDNLILSSVIARQMREHLPDNSTLRRLLEPHTKFTEARNGEILNDIASKISGHRLGRAKLPNLPDAEKDFVHDELQAKCEKYFFRNYPIAPDLSDDVPYQSFLKSYYGIFRNFIIEMSPLLTKDYEIVRQGIAKVFPGIAKQSMVDVLSTCLWSCSVVHTCDTESYLNQWAQRYGCLEVRTPLVIPKNKAEKKINIITISDGKDPSKSATQPAKTSKKQSKNVIINIDSPSCSDEGGHRFFKALDVFKTKNFLRTLPQHQSTSSDDLKLFNTKYEFTDPLAIAAAENFLTDIKDASAIIKQRGEAIVTGDKLLRSVCF